MNGLVLTPGNFAEMPIGIALVWAAMKLLDDNFAATTRTKVIAQILFSAIYAIVAAAVFGQEATVRGEVQQGIVLFLGVTFGQVYGYETVSKLVGSKGDGLPAAIPTKAPTKPEAPGAPGAGN